MRRALLAAVVIVAGCRCRGEDVRADKAQRPRVDSEEMKVCLDGIRGLSRYSDRCENSHLWWGSIDRAVEQLRPACEALVVAPGARFVRAEVDKCNAALEKAPCFEPPPPECRIGGALKAGEPCAFGAQCGPGLICGLAPGAICGKCVATLREGENCDGADNRSCAEGLACLLATRKCSTPLPEGGTCSDNSECRRPLFCDFKGGPEGTCTVQRKAGEPCTALECDPTLRCDEGKCVPRGAPKGPGANCADPLDCLDYACVHGVCGTPLAEGAKCSEESAPCSPSLMCIKGKCVLPDARQCK